MSPPETDPVPRVASRVDVTVVIPCLDEEDVVARCVCTARRAIDRAGCVGEVVVVDNGSTDRTAERARQAGARVVHEPRRGYGNAYRAGFGQARGNLVFMGDGDGTYDFGMLQAFIDAVERGADLVLGTRLRGHILLGALAWHRRLGTAMLTSMMNALFDTGVSDAHCGLRMVTASALQRMSLTAPGMEFASEMVIEARRAGLVIDEVPIVYRRRRGATASKLRAVPDGLRHVRYMLSQA